ncbi:hypothetical protein A3842_06640 [Paenibacillus sp. P3E]|uniref:hypothetical protein n=1 Tax=Paenibacillus sp. P3E TaxID=1349435 RepID=UPI00093EBA3A|nr:hypothetical protein [Paenibacillus sp. P3E]OKP86309.1 hypothetical protein A3842_06640 [Paenibacillus sp. P3E]
MDIILKIVLSGTIPILINLVIKALTSSSFDNLFFLKHQKTQQRIILYVVLGVLFLAYGSLLTAIYASFVKMKYTIVVAAIIIVLFLLGIMILGILCGIKWMKGKWSVKKFTLSETKANRLSFTVFMCNMVVFAVSFYDTLNITGLERTEHMVKILVCIGQFYIYAFLILKSYFYLIDYTRHQWNYVISPNPEDIDKRYLYVLYSLSPTQMVLSESNENVENPSSVYLFDITKQTYIHFERVATLKG